MRRGSSQLVWSSLIVVPVVAGSRFHKAFLVPGPSFLTPERFREQHIVSPESLLVVFLDSGCCSR